MTLVPLDSTEAASYKSPPHSLEAEQSLLGALLHNNNAYEKVSEFLQAEHFSQAVHGKIFESICHLIENGQVADPITLKDYFKNEEDLQSVGGHKYLIHLATSVVSIINVYDYGRIIYDFYLRRQLIDLGENIVNDAHTHDLDTKAIDQVEQAEKKLFSLATAGQTGNNFHSFNKALTEAIQSAEVAFKRDRALVGITTGLDDVDRSLGGLHGSDLLILAGRPSMGKTALATNMAFSAAKTYLDSTGKEGGRAAFFSLEMSAEQLANRLLAQESQVPSDKIRRGELKKDDFPKFVQVSRDVSKIPLYIDDTPALTVSAIRTRSRRLQRQEGLDLIIIDYLQLIQGSTGRNKSENRVQELSEITRNLKALAKELNVPVIALSQLSRSVEQREDKRPQLSDLRESGSIEQDADVVMFVFREEYYLSRQEPTEGSEKHRAWQERMDEVYKQAEIIIAKQRHGPVGNIKVYFDGNFTKFGNLSNVNYTSE